MNLDFGNPIDSVCHEVSDGVFERSNCATQAVVQCCTVPVDTSTADVLTHKATDCGIWL